MTEPARPARFELPPRYDPPRSRARWVRRWADQPFAADPASGKPPFTIVIPPPNVTGNLHLGHAFDNAIIDALIRFKRMQGFEALFQPGTDHAGISTQVQVERALQAEGTDRHALGREAFLERMWAWKERYGGIILEQLQRLGVSADWTRTRFTLDEGLSRAVRKQFVELYHRGASSAASASCTGTRQPHHALRPRGGPRGAARPPLPLAYPLEGGGRGEGARDRDRPAGDDLRRPGRGGAPGRPALRPPRRAPRAHPAHRPVRARHRRRGGRARLRHRRAEDHPGARPDRLRDRRAPRPGAALGHRPRRPAARRAGAGAFRGLDRFEARPLVVLRCATPAT
jgi:hypothetical protein